jgi:predicted tellurium resistance membrane protein TerC
VSKSSGLAGGAIVLSYGVGGFFFGLILSIILLRFASESIIKKVNWILLLIIFFFIGKIGYQLYLNNKQIEEYDPNPKKLKATEAIGSVGYRPLTTMDKIQLYGNENSIPLG